MTTSEPTLRPRARMTTSLGDIVIELNAEQAPISVLNFVRYAEDGYFAGTVFHRVMSNFMIQGGGLLPDMETKEGQRAPIKNEWTNDLTNDRGAIAMARLGGDVDSATSQFFINVVDNPFLDEPQSDGAAYAVFGKVVEGMETVDRIRDTRVGLHPNYPSPQPVTPTETVLIESVTLLDAFDKASAEKAAR